MGKVLIFDGDKCTGCRLCELACSMLNYGEYNPKKSRIKIIRNREMDVNIAAIDVACQGSCPKCVEVCMPGALEFVSVEEAAILRLNERKMGRFPAPLLAKI